jgi:hypothetical protein
VAGRLAAINSPSKFRIALRNDSGKFSKHVEIAIAIGRIIFARTILVSCRFIFRARRRWRGNKI